MAYVIQMCDIIIRMKKSNREMKNINTYKKSDDTNKLKSKWKLCQNKISGKIATTILSSSNNETQSTKTLHAKALRWKHESKIQNYTSNMFEMWISRKLGEEEAEATTTKKMGKKLDEN